MTQSESYRRIFHSFLLVMAIIVCYSGTLDNSWHLDDHPRIVENKDIHLQELTWGNIFKFFSADVQVSRSVVNLSFALNYYYSRLDPTSYHIVNISIHLICAVFVYLVFIHTLDIYTKDKGPLSRSVVHDIALLGVFFWALHPIQTQAVTYIVQRMASMSAMFYMIAFYCYLRMRLAEYYPRKVFLGFLVVLFWIAGIFSKENVVLLPLGILVYEVAFFRASLVEYRKVLFFSAATIVVSFVVLYFIAHTANVVELFLDPYRYRPFTMWERLITEPIILLRYLFLLICPIADFLTLESDIVASTGFLQPPVTLFANICVGGLVLFSIIYMRKQPLLCFALLFFFINHLVESSFIGLELYFEHRNYLPSIFLYLNLSYYLFQLCMHYREAGKLFMHNLFVISIIFVMISEGNATYLRNETWKDQITLLEDTVQKSPDNIRAATSLAVLYKQREQFDKALKLFYSAEQKAKDGHYQKVWVALLYYNMSNLFLSLQEYDDAFEYLIKSLNFDPKNWRAYVNLGYVFFEKGDLEGAEQALKKALDIKMNNEELYNMYGYILYMNKKYSDALKIFNAGMKYGVNLDLRLNLVATYLKMGELVKAKKEFLRIPYSEDDIVYSLYRLVILNDQEANLEAEKIVAMLKSNGDDVCNFLANVHQNKTIGIIYPDILSVEHLLVNEYMKSIRQDIKIIDAVLSVPDC